MREPKLAFSPDLLKLIAEIDEFKGRWEALRTLSADRLGALRKVATIESVGSSTRIEGSKLSDAETEDLLSRAVSLKSFKTKRCGRQSEHAEGAFARAGCRGSRAPARQGARTWYSL